MMSKHTTSKAKMKEKPDGRQREYRTYFGLTPEGKVMRFGIYQERERAINTGALVRRMTAHEVRGMGINPNTMPVEAGASLGINLGLDVVGTKLVSRPIVVPPKPVHDQQRLEDMSNQVAKAIDAMQQIALELRDMKRGI